jgi:predicted Zn-dependent protease
MPFDPTGNPYGKVTWVENGILKALAYDRAYARKKLNSDIPLPNPMAFRVSGGDTSVEQMIAATERGLLVTNTSGVVAANQATLTVSSVTRDGLFLIEHGKITHPVKNMWFTESPMTAFNKITHLGPPERTYGAGKLGWAGVLRDLPSRAVNDGREPIVVPPLRVEDFHFTRLIDAV